MLLAIDWGNRRAKAVLVPMRFANARRQFAAATDTIPAPYRRVAKGTRQTRKSIVHYRGETKRKLAATHRKCSTQSISELAR